MTHQSLLHLKPLFSIPMIPGMVENSWHIAPLLYLCFHAAFAVSDAGSTATNIKKENALLQHFAKAKKWQVLKICKTLSLISFEHSRVPHNLGKQREHFALVLLIPPLLRPVTVWPLGSWKSSLDSTGPFPYWSIPLLYKLLKGPLYPLKDCKMHLGEKMET